LSHENDKAAAELVDVDAFQSEDLRSRLISTSLVALVSPPRQLAEPAQPAHAHLHHTPAYLASRTL